MQTLWYAIISLMLSIYVVLDGFDFGAGILHLFVAKTDEERRTVLAAIGPYWNGNEVWLVASGGLLVFSFPRVYAAGFSGFYLPLMMVLWLLVLRGLSIEFRSKENNSLWRSFWDAIFFLSSSTMAIVLGAALGNVIRGVPVGLDGYFDGPLFTNFLPGPHPGVLDWYTVSVGVFALLTLAGHAALFLAWKTEGAVYDRAVAASKVLWPVIAVTGAVVTVQTAFIRPLIYQQLLQRPWSWSLAVLIIAGLAGVLGLSWKRRDLAAFLCSAGFILGLLAATAAGMYPNMLISTVDPAATITADNGSIGATGLTFGLMWWAPTLLLAVLYFANLFRTFRGKANAAEYH